MGDQEIGVVGLATMGMNLSRNLASRGAGVAVYNRTRKRTDDFMTRFGSEGDFRAAFSLGELVIDGGNSLFHDTRRRGAAAANAGFSFLGTGVSGGEEGALHGPSLMPG